jgi:MerR family transcriptional regulator, copper efflux regulator
MKIGELARLTGASVKAIRLYESMGLVRTAGRSPGNYRLFPPEAIACVRAIKGGRELGLSLEDLRVLARTFDAGIGIEAELLAKLLERADELEKRIEGLRQIRRRILSFCEERRAALGRSGGMDDYWLTLQERARREYAAEFCAPEPDAPERLPGQGA